MRCPVCGAELVFVGRMYTLSEPRRVVLHYVCPRCGYFGVISEVVGGGE